MLVEVRLGKPHYENVAELFQVIRPASEDLSGDAIRMAVNQLKSKHRLYYDSSETQARHLSEALDKGESEWSDLISGITY